MINVYQKRGSRSDFKAEMYFWLIQRRGGTIASLFFSQKTIFLYFENIISPVNTTRCRNWVTSPLAAKISCSLTRCTFVFYAKQTTQFIDIFAYKIWTLSQLARITQLQNTIFIYREILNKTSLALMFTSDILSIFFSLIIKSSICCILFVSLSDRIFILFFAHNLARIFIPKKKLNFQISLRIKWSPHNRYIGGSRGGQVPHFVLCYRLVKTYFNRIFPNY